MPLADSYLDIDGLKARTVMPSADVDALVATEGAFVATCLQDVSSEITSKLRKRYGQPFAGFVAPFPRIVMRWLADIVTPMLYDRRGWNPAQENRDSIEEAAERARKQLDEAADPQNGLYDLPPVDGALGTAITKGAPIVLADVTPYDGLDRQRDPYRGW